MKNLLSVLLIGMFFIGCTQKTIVIDTQKQQVLKQEEIAQPKKEETVEPIAEEPIVKQPIVEEDAYKKIALIYPSKVVGPYAKSTVNTITSFLLFSKQPFILETFDSFDENSQNINYQIEQLKQKGFKNIIAMYTQAGFEILNSMYDIDNLKIYFPLINKDEIQTTNENFIFGGISYFKQLEVLQSVASRNNSMFYVDSYIGNKLKDDYIKVFGLDTNIKRIENQNNQYKDIMEDEKLKESTVMLNTPIIKSSIIMSQLTAYEINPIAILSTQLNYNPLLIRLTQDIDRTNFYVINSIGKSDDFIQEYCTLLESDIVYNWVDYSSLVGISYLLNENQSDIIETKVIDNQAQYELNFYKSTSYGFEKIDIN